MSKQATVYDLEKRGKLSKVYAPLPISILNVDGYQKLPYETRINHIVKNFDPALLGDIVVNKRLDGTYYIIDGQNRCLALEKLGYKTIQCIIHEGLTPLEEAKIYDGLGVRNQQTPNEKIKSALFMGEPYAVELNDIVKRQGLEICLDRSGRGILCGKTLIRVQKKYGAKILGLSLWSIIQCFPANSDALVKNIIMGFSMFLDEFETTIDKHRMIDSIKKVGFERFNAEAKALATARTQERGVKEAIKYFYDYNRRTKIFEDRY